MNSKNNTPSTIRVNGYEIDTEDYMRAYIGAPALAIAEMILNNIAEQHGRDLSGGELKFVQFCIERAHGQATKHIEVTRHTEQEIAAATLADIDEDTLRKIAAANAPRQLT